MPIKIQSDLPVKEILEKENLFVMDENRAMHQDIRPIYILILNLMPLKEETELQLLRSLSNTPLQVDVSFMAVESHQAKNTSRSHLNKFYQTFSELKDKKFDGMIITGAPVEQMEFEEVDYWEEVTQIMDWCLEKSQFYSCYQKFFQSTPHADLLQIRMDKAKNLLTNEALTVQQIAQMCGFSDFSHFSRYFRKQAGCSPLQWRRKMGEPH